MGYGVGVHGVPWFRLISGRVAATAYRDGVLSVYVRRRDGCFFVDAGAGGVSVSNAECLDVDGLGWARDDGVLFNVFTGASVRCTGRVTALGRSLAVCEDGGRLRRRVKIVSSDGVLAEGYGRLLGYSADYRGASIAACLRDHGCLAILDLDGGVVVEKIRSNPHSVICRPGMIILGDNTIVRLVGRWGVYEAPLSPSILGDMLCSLDGSVCLVCRKGGDACLLASSNGIMSVRVPGGLERYLPLASESGILLVPRIAGTSCILVDRDGVREAECAGLVFAELVDGLFMAAFHGGGLLRVEGVDSMAALYPWILLVRSNGGVLSNFSWRIDSLIRMEDGNRVKIIINDPGPCNEVLLAPRKFRVSVCSMEGGGCVVSDGQVSSAVELTLPPEHFPRSLVRVFLEPLGDVAAVVREEVVAHRGVNVVVKRHSVRCLRLNWCDTGKLYVHVLDLVESNPYHGLEIRYTVPDDTVYSKVLRRGRRVRIIALTRTPRLSLTASLRGIRVQLVGLNKADYLGTVDVDFKVENAQLLGPRLVAFTYSSRRIVGVRCVSGCRLRGRRLVCGPGCHVQLSIAVDDVYVRVPVCLDKIVNTLLEELSGDFDVVDVDVVDPCILIEATKDGGLILEKGAERLVVRVRRGDRIRLCRPDVDALLTPRGELLQLPSTVKPSPRLWLDSGAVTVSAPGCLLIALKERSYTLYNNTAVLNPLDALRGVRLKIYYPGGVEHVNIDAGIVLMLAAKAAYIVSEHLKLLKHIGADLLDAGELGDNPTPVDIEA